MNKRLIIAIISAILVLALLYPKGSRFEDSTTIKVCNCIGIGTASRCFGIPSGCHAFSKDELRNVVEEASKPKSGIELTLLLDRSKSMEGEKMQQAKSAAKDLISSMSAQDSMAIIGFDKEAELLQGFTGDKTALSHTVSDISASDETYYIPALKRAYSNSKENSRSSTRKIIFLSDGEPSGDEDINSIYDLIYEITGSGICIYTIGYGNDVYNGSRAESILKNIASISRERAGCGNYYHSSRDMYALRDIFSNIYLDYTDRDLEITLEEPRKLVYNSLEVPVNLSTNVMAVCSYSLNNGNSVLIFNNSFMLSARPGRNILDIECKKSTGKRETKKTSAEFYVKVGIWTILTQGRKSAGKRITPLDKEHIEFMLDDIIEKQKLNVIKRMSLQDGGTTVYLLLENTKPVPLRDVHISQSFPADIISSVDELSSSDSYQITGISPVQIEFSVDKIDPDGVVSLSYHIDHEIDQEQLSSIKTEISYDAISKNDLEKVILSQNRTRDLFDISVGSSREGDTTHGIIRLSPKKEVSNLKIYLDVPKCMAYRLNKIYFKNSNYRVVSDDPLVLWQLPDAKGDIDIEYDTDNALEKECEQQISILTIGEPMDIESQEIHKASNTMIILLPLMLLPLIIIIIINKRFTGRQSTNFHRRAVRLALIIVMIAFMVFFFLPKERFRDGQLCQCFGVSSSERCYGVSHSCFIPESYLESEKEKGSDCIISSCDDLQKYMKTDPYSNKEKGVDLLLLLDHSKSMEGEKMQQAKAAIINLVSQIEPYNRVSVIKFDDSSDLVQQFTSDKQEVIESIKDIDVGYSTKYVPALTTAHRNFLDNGDKQNQWQVIFVSDGAPGDDDKPESIYKKVREMAEDDICINTIGFGSEITPGSEAETILKEMARISKSITGCGTYSYSVREMSSLTGVLGRMYEESKTAKQGIDIEPDINSLNLASQEELSISARLFSKVNSQPLPGEFQIGAKRYCSPEADVSLELRKGNKTVKEYGFEYDYPDKDYMLNVMNLPAGSYDAWIRARVEPENITGCSIENSMYIGTMDITGSDSFDKCSTDDCLEISKYLFSSNIKNTVSVFITDYAYVPRNISIIDGTTVVWKNIGKKPHTVTSGRTGYSGIFNSGSIMPGGSFNFTFRKGDSYDYFDNLSRDLKGSTYTNRTKNISIGNFSLEYKNNIDLLILIDRSGSMAGDKLDNVKKAADRLVRMIYPGDRVSVVKFSDDANIVDSFTEDKDLLKSSIDKLQAGGSTQFIPAFHKASESYSMYGNNRSGRVIIFLSDGEPWDKNSPYSIYKAADDLISQGICVYAIGYGEDVFPGSKSEEILKEIVSRSEDSTECGKYMYSPSDEIRLSKIFGSIYYEATGEIEGLRLEPEVSKRVLYDNESLIIKTRVKSIQNNRYLPGYDNVSGLCGPPALVTAYLKTPGGKTREKVALAYLGEHTGYYAKLQDIKAGQYLLDIEAQSLCSDDEPCNYFGSETLDLTVLKSSRYSVEPLFLVFAACLLATFAFLFFRRNAPG